MLGGKQYVEGVSNTIALWALVIVICLLLITVYAFQSVKYLKVLSKENYISYSAGANQRFEQRNTDPTLGKQFGPYNMEITGEQALFGKTGYTGSGGTGNRDGYGGYGQERLTSDSEPPVVYNFGNGMGRAPESGLAPTNDSANSEGTPGDSTVESLISDLYG
jgi:hypothetical protein